MMLYGLYDVLYFVVLNFIVCYLTPLISYYFILSYLRHLILIYDILNCFISPYRKEGMDRKGRMEEICKMGRMREMNG